MIPDIVVKDSSTEEKFERKPGVVYKTLIIGNGVSRKPIDLSTFSVPYDITIGCNKIFDTFMPNYLVVMDREVLQYVANSEKLSDTYIWNSLIVPSAFDKKRLFTSNSGSMAIRTVVDNFTESNIDFIGFDSVINTETNGENMYDYNHPIFAKRSKLLNYNSFLTAHFKELCKLKNKKSVIRYHLPIEAEGKLFKKFISNMLYLENPVFIVFFDSSGRRVKSINIEEYCDNHEMKILDSLPKQYRDLANEYGTIIDGEIIWDANYDMLKPVEHYRQLALNRVEIHFSHW